VIETATFVCSICNEPSTAICVYCTKDTCRNHRCERCKRCSDCCECEVPLVEPTRQEPVVAIEAVADVPVMADGLSEPVPELISEPVDQPVLPAPPEASEEPDLNVPAPQTPTLLEPPAEPEHHE